MPKKTKFKPDSIWKITEKNQFLINIDSNNFAVIASK